MRILQSTRKFLFGKVDSLRTTWRMPSTKLVILIELTEIQMKHKTLAAHFVVAIATLICSANSFGGVTEIFVSFSDFGDSNAQNNTVKTYAVGESGAAFVWLADGTNVDTLSVVNAVLSNASAVTFTNSVLMNPAVIGGPGPLTRWDTVQDGLISANGDAVIGMSGGSFTPSSTGIRIAQTGEGTQTDLGFDASNGTNAFLLARLDFIATQAGTVDIGLTGLLLNDDQLLDFDSSSATINVSAVPEPTAGLLLLATTAALLRRKRA